MVTVLTVQAQGNQQVSVAEQELLSVGGPLG